MTVPGDPDEGIEPPRPPRRRPYRDDLEEEEDLSDVDIRLDADDPDNPSDLTPGDWAICILCSGVGCIMAIARLIQGKRNAGKMLGVSLAFAALWSVLRFLLMTLQP